MIANSTDRARPIYMDNAATTQLDVRVLEAMMPYFVERYGNAASRTHAFGWEAEEATEIAREQIAELLGASPREVIFTSGATEANNLAIRGTLEHAHASGRRHLVISAIEHPAVLDVAKALARQGSDLTILGVDKEGRVDPKKLARALRPETALVSIMAGNNETGVLQDVRALGEICREAGVPFHTDATQCVGKVPIDLKDLPCDLLSLSAHKFHGPKGVGALFLRKDRRRLRLAAQMLGGGHENGARSGTQNVPGIVGLGAAAALAKDEMAETSPRVADLLQRLEDGLAQSDGWIVNTPATGRLPGILSLCPLGLEAEAVLLGLRSVAISSGSACASASLEPSHVILALGHNASMARNSLRFSLSKFNTAEEVDTVIQDFVRLVSELRRIRSAHQLDGTD